MEIILIISIILATTSISKIIDVASFLTLVKQIADSGYKIDPIYIGKLKCKFYNDEEVDVLYSLSSIPFFDISSSLRRLVQIRNDYLILDEFVSTGMITKMNHFENETYLQNPTGIRALKIEWFVKIRYSNMFKLKVKNNDMQSGEVFFEIKNSEINIYKKTELAANLYNEDIIFMINQILNDKHISIDKNFKKSIDTLFNNITLNVDNIGKKSKIVKFEKTHDLPSELEKYKNLKRYVESEKQKLSDDKKIEKLK